MADWSLLFRCPAEAPRIEAIAERVAAVIEAAVRTDAGELSGNPRDGYYTWASITGEGVEVSTTLSAWDAAGVPEAGDLRVTLKAPSFAAKLDMWQRLRGALVLLGYTDATLVGQPCRLVDDAEAAGELETAARWRAEIRQALVVESARLWGVRLVDTRVDDVEALLVAIPEPETKDEITIANCRLNRVPAAVGRFVNIKKLTFADDAPDLGGLRGAWLPRLEKLVLESSGIRRIGREDVAGLPALAEIDFTGSKIQEIDPSVIDVCPKLRHVRVSQTALGFESRKAALRERWKGVTLE